MTFQECINDKNKSNYNCNINHYKVINNISFILILHILIDEKYGSTNLCHTLPKILALKIEEGNERYLNHIMK